MHEKLILFLQMNPEPTLCWISVNAQGEKQEEGFHSGNESLLFLTKNKEIIVFVPAEDVLLLNVDLPQMSHSRLMQAIPYSLEEQLTDDVDQLHFAIASSHQNNTLPVAIVASEKMVAWLKQLASWEIRPDVLTSTLFAIPYEAVTWKIILNDDHAFIRMLPFSGFACDKENLFHFLVVALKDNTEVPSHIHIHNYTDSPWTYTFPNVSINEEFHAATDFYADLAQAAIASESINLLQGAFGTRKSKRFANQHKLWKGLGVICALWIFILFLSPSISYLLMQKKLSSLTNEINQIYKYHFPKASSIIAPKMRMQEKLQRLTNNAGQNRALLLIGNVSQVLPDFKNVHLKKMDYQNNRLTLEINAKSSEDLGEVTASLTKLGLKVKQQNANVTGPVVSATLTIE